MKTNNHPANGPVSLDRLHQIREILSKAAEQSDGGNLGYTMADAVKVIDGAIAAFGAEPAPVDIEMLATVLRNAPLAPSDSQGKPRAPVVPEEIDVNDPALDTHRKWMAEGWNRCRAAMLQAGNSPVAPDGYVLVPKEMTPEMMRAVQIKSELGGYAASELSGAYDMFAEFWDVAVSAAPQQEDL
ncbi:TPA: hypothetical protein ACUB6F_004832 [Citrobacter freundii]